MRLKSEIWVKAYIRSASGRGVQAYVVSHGDDDAGAIFIHVNRLDGTSELYGPAPTGFDAPSMDRRFMPMFSSTLTETSKVELYLSRERENDPDVWIIEVETRAGEHGLESWLSTPGDGSTG